ncbi:uncharacterized protein LOC111076273 isoform X2 [Drosophila obscura]|nr:uncharacterized protein LOC111076273 isoform X2 [Drosophila obscura]XP_041449184.1 uncharacterized protein LOC111076273 isoform X2 [Drosophila obscura]XP_041449185.1 uncharacterized protein LOC111076273 isoform X2 [Drosophila obscura]
MWKILFLIHVGLAGIWATDYELLLEDPDIFTPCTEAPPGTIFIRDAINFDQLKVEQEADTIHISGNATTTWDLQPNDRIAAKFALFHHQRGNWEPTVFTMATKDFCPMMYDKDQYWFKYWTSFITNREDVEQHCIKKLGTTLIHEPFDLRLMLKNIRGATLSGRYKTVISFEAFDERNVPRPHGVCFEIRGEAEKIKK